MYMSILSLEPLERIELSTFPLRGDCSTGLSYSGNIIYPAGRRMFDIDRMLNEDQLTLYQSRVVYLKYRHHVRVKQWR